MIVNQLDDLEEKYHDYPKTPYEKKEKKKTTKGASKKTTKKSTAPLMQLSPELSAIVGEKELSRGQVTKKVWEYIKAHDLQDPKNKRLIVPDAKLAKVFGNKNSIDMLKLAGVLGKHLKKL